MSEEGGDMSNFLKLSRGLANIEPPKNSRINRVWQPNEVQAICFDSMFARVAVSPRRGTYTSVMLFVGGQRRTVRRFDAELSGTTLTLSAAIPFAPRGRHAGKQQANNSSVPQGIHIGGRRINTSRCLDIMCIVPHSTEIIIGEMVGAVGIGAGVEVIRFATTNPLHVYSPRAGLVTGTFSGEGSVTVDEVGDPASDIRVTGDGQVILGKHAVNG